jgi:hypothetical protein
VAASGRGRAQEGGSDEMDPAFSRRRRRADKAARLILAVGCCGCFGWWMRPSDGRNEHQTLYS